MNKKTSANQDVYVNMSHNNFCFFASTFLAAAAVVIFICCERRSIEREFIWAGALRIYFAIINLLHNACRIALCAHCVHSIEPGTPVLMAAGIGENRLLLVVQRVGEERLARRETRRRRTRR